MKAVSLISFPSSSSCSSSLSSSCSRSPHPLPFHLAARNTNSGTFPTSFEARKLAVLELHYSNFSGFLPALDYASIADCMLYNNRWTNTDHQGNNVFTCPLPPGAAACGAVCQDPPGTSTSSISISE